MKWHMYTNPLLPPFNFFTPIKGGGGGHGPLYPSAMPVPVVQPGFVNLGSKRGSKATERGEGFSPFHGREIF